MKSFPRLVHVVLNDILDLYTQTGSSKTNAANLLRTRLLKVVQVTGNEVNNASFSNNADDSILNESFSLSSLSQTQSALESGLDEHSVSTFSNELERLCLREGNPKQAKNAVSVLAALATRAAVPTTTSAKKTKSGGKSKSSAAQAESSTNSNIDEAIARVVSALSSSKHLKSDNKRILAVLHALRQVAKSFPTLFAPHAQKVSKFHFLSPSLAL